LLGEAPGDATWAGTGRELFALFRRHVGATEGGASVIPRPLESTV
jgi:phosphogluconate dehydratase